MKILREGNHLILYLLSHRKYLAGRVDGWMDGWMGGWMEGKAGLRIAYSNQQTQVIFIDEAIDKNKT